MRGWRGFAVSHEMMERKCFSTCATVLMVAMPPTLRLPRRNPRNPRITGNEPPTKMKPSTIKTAVRFSIIRNNNLLQYRIDVLRKNVDLIRIWESY